MDHVGFTFEEILFFESNFLSNFTLKGLSGRRIDQLVNEALQSLNATKPSVNYQEQLVNSIRKVYDHSESLVMFHIYFIGLTILIFRRGLIGRELEYDSLVFNSILIGSISLAILGEQFSPKLEKVTTLFVNKIKQWKTNHLDPLETRVMLRFLEVIGKLTYVLCNFWVRVTFYAIFVIHGLQSLFFKGVHPKHSFIILYTGSIGLYSSCKNFYQNVNKGLKQIILDFIDPNNLTIQSLAGRECSISLEDIKLVGQLSHCKHVFELYHIIRWLQGKDTCPICRTEVVESEDETKNRLVFLPREKLEVKDSAVNSSKV